MKNLQPFLISFLVFVLPLNTNAKNMETNFYYQTILDDVLPTNQIIGNHSSDFIQHHMIENYQSMISDSNLCWAACMESLIKGYEAQSKIGKEQLEIAEYYSKHFCQDSKLTHSKIHKIPMKDHHYEAMYLKAGFQICSWNVNHLEQYSKVQSALRNNSTLIVRSHENEQSHILLIVGFKDGRYHVLDPDENSKSSYYWAPKNIVMKYSIERLWSVSLN